MQHYLSVEIDLSLVNIPAFITDVLNTTFQKLIGDVWKSIMLCIWTLTENYLKPSITMLLKAIWVVRITWNSTEDTKQALLKKAHNKCKVSNSHQTSKYLILLNYQLFIFNLELIEPINIKYMVINENN